MDRYIVAGNPIHHSLSPVIHNAFAEQTRQSLVYERLLVPLGQFAQYLDQFKHSGGLGANITLPFKVNAYYYVSSHSQRAKKAQAVNTIVFDGEGSYGDNTDGVGLVTDIKQNLGWGLQGKSILVLGAGGAVRGILAPLLAENPALVVVYNRTESKAADLVNEFSNDGNIALWGNVTPVDAFDLIINGASRMFHATVELSENHSLLTPEQRQNGGTSVQTSSMAITTPLDAEQEHFIARNTQLAKYVSTHTACYDMNYGEALSNFLAHARQMGCHQLSDGLGMLVEQAAAAFELWRKVKPETAGVLQLLRSDPHYQMPRF